MKHGLSQGHRAEQSKDTYGKLLRVSLVLFNRRLHNFWTVHCVTVNTDLLNLKLHEPV
jgi:hypothetical protein